MSNNKSTSQLTIHDTSRLILTVLILRPKLLKLIASPACQISPPNWGDC